MNVILKTGETVTVEAAHGARLIEQRLARLAPAKEQDGKPAKARKAKAAAKDDA